MSLFNRKKRSDTTKTPPSAFGIWLKEDGCPTGYTRLSDNPEILTGCRRIAQMLATATIRLMNNTKDGDVRIENELSRTVDINPMPNMTRQKWMEAIVMTLLLYGDGNAVVQPHTWQGYIQSLEPIAAQRVGFEPIGYRDYRITIDGKSKNPGDLLHFTLNPDSVYLWKGKGLRASLKDIANNLKQATETEKAFMSSEYKPSIIVKVDALTDEFSSPEGRQKLLDSYVKPSTKGEPWLIPAEAFDVEQVKPLTLGDLAIKDTVELDKRTVAAILGVPPFMVGVGEYKREEFNYFVQTTIMALAKGIAQELTKKLLINPSWYFELNVWSLMDYDLKSMSDILLAGSDRGFVNGDEWRDRMHMNPAGLKEYKILENYIPYDLSGAQKKLVQDGE